jgi:capsular exopolysaccharide synthesis family protein
MLPELRDRRVVEHAASPAPPVPASIAPSVEEAHTAPPGHYWWLIRSNGLGIAAVVVACLGVTWAITARITPIYEATATVDIDRQTPTGVIGQDAVRANLNDADQYLSTQIRLIQSDSVLRPVALKYDLVRHESGEDSPADGPIQLRRLKVTRPSSTYLLTIGYRSPDPALAASVANAVADSYLDHSYQIRYRATAQLSSFMERQLEELRAKMEKSSAALSAFERELNIISPEEKTGILSARLLQLNTEYTAAQADRVRKEAARQSVLGGSLETSEGAGPGGGLRRLIERRNEARERFAEIQAHFGKNHPEYRKAAEKETEIERQIEAMRATIVQRAETEYSEAVNREQLLSKTVAQTKNEFDALNARSFEYQSLKREADADKKLYEELVRRIKEAGINASFQNSTARIADRARPASAPVSPNLKLNLFLALLASLSVSLLAIVARDALDDSVRDPEKASRQLGADVIGSLPVVRTGRLRVRRAPDGRGGVVVHGMKDETLQAGYEESIRSLRNAILLSDAGHRARSLLITSAAPGEGKSTMAAHLALAHTGQNRRTLLIDCDLRRPSVHRRFKLDGSRGLTNVLMGEIGWRDALLSGGPDGSLSILPAGPPSTRAADLFGRSLETILREAEADFDLVILDGPPLLGFAEPMQMAALADAVIVVARAGATSRKQIVAVISALKRLRANLAGVVLNQVHRGMSDSYAYYAQYGKYYAERTAS